MTILEQLARYLAAKLSLPFEDVGAEASVFFGALPDAPAKAVCVYASDLRPAGDDDGSRVQVILRSDSDGGWPAELSARVMALLDEARDVAFVPDGCYVNRVETERGFEFTGTAANGAQFYAARFRIYTCGGESV